MVDIVRRGDLGGYHLYLVAGSIWRCARATGWSMNVAHPYDKSLCMTHWSLVTARCMLVKAAVAVHYVNVCGDGLERHGMDLYRGPWMWMARGELRFALAKRFCVPTSCSSSLVKIPLQGWSLPYLDLVKCGWR